MATEGIGKTGYTYGFYGDEFKEGEVGIIYYFQQEGAVRLLYLDDEEVDNDVTRVMLITEDSGKTGESAIFLAL